MKVVEVQAESVQFLEPRAHKTLEAAVVMIKAAATKVETSTIKVATTKNRNDNHLT